MLIAPMLPQATATQVANAAATQAAFAAAASASASRPMTPGAVSATAVVSGYQPQVAEQRRPVQQQSTPAMGDSKGRPSILPNDEFWRVPDRQVDVPLPQPQAARAPVVTPQQAAPFVAQAAAQQTPEVKTQQRSEEPAPALPGSRKPAALLGKKPGVESSGFDAYAVASQRTVSIDLPTTVEAFA